MGGCHCVVVVGVGVAVVFACVVVGWNGCSLRLVGCVVHGCLRRCWLYSDLRSLGLCGWSCWIDPGCFAIGVAVVVVEVEVCWDGGVC